MSSRILEAHSSSLILGEQTRRSHIPTFRDAFILALLTPTVLLIHGYHPLADDAGIYVASIRKLLNPTLFSFDSSFVLAHTKLSVFSYLFATGVKLFHIPLELALFVAYLLSIFVFLLSGFQLSCRIFRNVDLRWGATLLACALFTLPVAATSLWIMDPYVTARSFSTPFSLFSLTACIDRNRRQTILWFAAVALLHPLMAAHTAAFLLAYILVNGRRWRWLTIVILATFAGAGVEYLLSRHAPLPDGYREVVLTRIYFFFTFWHWYELLGLIIPLALMLIAANRAPNGVIRNLCISCVATGVTASAVAACFVHTDGSFLLARIQPLRAFLLIYIVCVLLLGGFLSERLHNKHALLAVVLLLISSLMLVVQHKVYTTSAHVEWPYATPQNSWQKAFVWIRVNTPENAVFAIDSDYTKVASEDTQGFRATTLRSSLVDELKDGGVAAIFPELAPLWKEQRDLVLELDRINDDQRTARLRSAGVTWILLSADSTTRFDCPYRNNTVVVCRLP